MGISLSCPLATYSDLESGLQSIIVKSVSLVGDEQLHPTDHSIPFKDQPDSDPQIVNNQPQLPTLISPSFDLEDFKLRVSDTLLSSPKHEAAVKLQKVYKSFRTRRKLADCAVLVEQSWWKLLDFAELKHSSISFFDIEHHETAISRWSRAKTRAAKVGKGLSKNGKARKLALQHWLEAIDPRHRYGHNLDFYYTKWLESQSREPFFYWLDIGEGKEINLEKCSRWKLQQQCIKYLGPMERKAYEVAIEDGKFFFQKSGEILDSSSDPNAKWIFVLSASKTLYVSKKRKGIFQHSSFLAGGATSAAGRLLVENGLLKAVWPHSGHYRPTSENFQEFISFLREHKVDLTDVKMDPVDEDEQLFGKQRSSLHFRNSSEEDLAAENAMENGESIKSTTAEAVDSTEQVTLVLSSHPTSNHSRSLKREFAYLQIPRRDELFVRMQSEIQAVESRVDDINTDNGYDSATEEASASEQNDQLENEGVLVEEHEVDGQKSIPAESILRRINSHKETKSFQLGKQLSCKWTTGAGPRIGCVRDYPAELQFRALEQVNLSPRSACAPDKSLLFSACGAGSAPKSSTPISIVTQRSIEQCKVLSPLSKGRKFTY